MPHARSPKPRTVVTSMIGAVGALLAGLALAACPRALEPPPAAGDPCTDEADCNPEGMTCGELRLCVGGRCEEGRSLRVPCR